MHSYLQKLVNQGWIGSNWRIVGWQSGGHNLKFISTLRNYKTARRGIEKQLIKLTSFLPQDYTLKYRVHSLRVSMGEQDLRCPVTGCNGWLKNNGSQDGEDRFFMRTCGKKDQDHKDKIWSDRNDKSKEVWKKTLGVDNPLKHPDVVQKASDTYFNRTGFKNPSNNPDVVLKREGTSIKNWGVKHPSQSPIIQDKIFGVWSEKYSEGHPLRNSEVRKSHSSIAHINQENRDKLSKEYIEDNFIDHNDYLKVPEFKTFLNCSTQTVFNMCHEFGVDYGCMAGSSRAEKDILLFIKNLYSKAIYTNTQKIIAPKELDLYIPDEKIAIEYNGMPFHSHGISEWSVLDNPTPIPNRHLTKSKACQEKDIDLIHIFEVEYINNKSSVELLIKRKLGLELWPIYTQDIVYWNLNQGQPSEQLRSDYVIIKVVPPRPNYFRSSRPQLVSQWTPFKTDVELYNAGYRKYYDCGQLTLRRNND